MKDIIKKYGKTALAVATFVAVLHALWALLVAIGVGETFFNWVFLLHFISTSYAVIDFSIGTALLLTVTSFVVSYIATIIFAMLWQAMNKKK